MTEEIFLKLDLGEYLDKFNSFLARQKPLFLQGDSKIHFENISELSKYDFKAPDEIKEMLPNAPYLAVCLLVEKQDISEVRAEILEKIKPHAELYKELIAKYKGVKW